MIVYDKPITIQKMDEVTEDWSDLFPKSLHARVNKSSGSESLEAGSIRSKTSLSFDVRYFKDLEQIRLNTQIYRIVYRGHVYNIVDYDDYMEQHMSIKLKGEAI